MKWSDIFNFMGNSGAGQGSLPAAPDIFDEAVLRRQYQRKQELAALRGQQGTFLTGPRGLGGPSSDIAHAFLMAKMQDLELSTHIPPGIGPTVGDMVHDVVEQVTESPPPPAPARSIGGTVPGAVQDVVEHAPAPAPEREPLTTPQTLPASPRPPAGTPIPSVAAHPQPLAVPTSFPVTTSGTSELDRLFNTRSI